MERASALLRSNVTITDIAREAEVSNQVVSKVLHGGRSTIRTSEKTRLRILQIASEMGYRPNSFARSMRSQRFGTICLLQSSVAGRSLMPPVLLDAIYEALEARNLHLTVAKLPDEQLVKTGFVPRILREWACDGLIINYNHQIPARMIELIAQNRLPAVWINSKQAGRCVFPDDVAAGEMATKLLVEAGHRRIAYVDYSHPVERRPTSHHSTHDRFEGYARVLQAAGGTPRCIGGDDEVKRGERAEFSRSWLLKPDRPTAIVAYTHWEARSTLVAALSIGLRVPQDISIVVVHAAGQLMDVGFAVDTVELPEVGLGNEAVRLVLEQVEHPDAVQPPMAIRPNYIPGVTIAPPDSDATLAFARHQTRCLPCDNPWKRV